MKTFPRIIVAEDLDYGSRAGGRVDVCLPSDPTGSSTSRAAIICIHGGSWRAGNKANINWRSVCQWLASEGCVSFEACPQAVRASPLFPVDDSDPPFFIAHSRNERIPLSQSTEFVRAPREDGIDTTFVTVRGHLHSVAMLSDDLRSPIATFFHTQLDGAADVSARSEWLPR